MPHISATTNRTTANRATMLLSLCHILFVLLLITSTTIHAQPLSLPPLPYPYNALEPCISEQTLRSHHLSHHQTYTDRTNTILTQLRSTPHTKHLARWGVDTLVQHIHNVTLPLTDEQRVGLRNNGGGYINHIHYFESLTPPLIHSASSDSSANRSMDEVVDLSPAEGSEVSALIVASFGSFDAFKAAFTSAAQSVFGSGWTWLTYTPKLHSLSIQSTQQQDSPWMEEQWIAEGGVVLLGLDLWEHSFYLDYQSKRAEYVKAWWKIVDWERVEQRLVKRSGSATKSSVKQHQELR